MTNEDLFANSGFAAAETLLHDTAVAQVGHDDFGDPAYLEGLRVLLKAYDEEAKFNAYGRGATFHMVLDLLKKRLRSESFLKQTPAPLLGDIKRPIIICGLVRTGSTALHYLMGQDPDTQHLQYWLASNPQPRPPRHRWENNADFKASEAELEAMYAADPSLKAIHFMMADGPEECRHLLSQGFTDDGFEVNASVPSYSQWYESANIIASYRLHRRLLQLIGSSSPDVRWLLKYPVHLRHLPALLEVYPDACIVWTHRDPAQVLPSYCSLMAGFRAIFEDNCDPKDMAQRQLALWAGGTEKAIACRQSQNPAQFYDLHFKDFMADPIAAVKDIYRHFDQSLSQDGEHKLRDWQTDNPQHKHGKHEYSADIGVDAASIHRQFAGYMEHFNLRPEA